MIDAAERERGRLTDKEIIDQRTGIYLCEKTQQWVALAFSDEGIRDLGRCSMCISLETQKWWKQKIWKIVLP